MYVVRWETKTKIGIHDRMNKIPWTVDGQTIDVVVA